MKTMNAGAHAQTEKTIKKEMLNSRGRVFILCGVRVIFSSLVISVFVFTKDFGNGLGRRERY